MKKVLIVAIIALVVLFLIKLVTTSVDDNFTAEQEPFQLYGEGQQATRQFNLENGINRFYINNTPEGENTFSVSLMDENGKEVEKLVDVIGGYAGWKDVEITQAGAYSLNISADGEWLVTVD